MDYLYKNLQRLEAQIKDRPLFIFLDFDGTLAPVASSPDKAALPQRTSRALKKLSAVGNCKIAVISGRAMRDIKKKIGLHEIIYAGNHGLEIEGPRIKFTKLVSARYKSILKHLKEELRRRLSPIKGALLENKGLSLSVHYRLADKKDIARVKGIVHECSLTYLRSNEAKLRQGKMVLEIRPHSELGKGGVSLWLLARQIFKSKNKNILPLYIGDDLSDEDAFRALKGKGITVFVGKKRISHARYYLRDFKEVRAFLERILKLKS